MRIEEEQLGAISILRPVGALTNTDALDVLKQFDRVARESLGRWVLDLSAVPYLDSGGVETLAEMSDRAAQRGQIMRLCSLQPTVSETLELTDLAPMFDRFPDVHAAIRSFL